MTHPDTQYVATLDDAAAILLARVQPGDVIITLGAGDGYQIGERVLRALHDREAEGSRDRAGAGASGGDGRPGE
jgi:UDP-N-acetylmuramate--alanine ligase